MNFERLPFVLLLAFAVSSCSLTAMGDRDTLDETLPAAAASAPSTSTSDLSPSENTTSEDVVVTDTAGEENESNTNEIASLANQVSEEDVEPVMPALLRFIDNRGANLEETEYRVEYVDLNEDGINEALVLLSGSYWCGTGGCNMAVFEGTTEGYSLSSNLSLINAPVWVSPTRSSGWNDLIVEISGGGIEAQHVALRFSGSRYPVNPSLEPAVNQEITQSSKALFRTRAVKSISMIQSHL